MIVLPVNNEALNHSYLFVLRMGRKAVGHVCFIQMQIKKETKREL